MSDLKEQIGKVLGQIPSGVFILTARNGDGQHTGMLASWVQQASFEPPAVTVAVNKSRYLNDWLSDSPEVALNLVGESQTEFLKHFGRGFEPGQSAFERVNTLPGENGSTLLADSLGILEGRVTGRLESGDHVVYLLEISSARGGSSDEKPMVHLRKSGFGY